MVRQCAANACNNTDLTTAVTHRFPKDTEMASKWKEALGISQHTVQELQKGFVVCTKHFTNSSYRNEIANTLNTTAIPNLQQNADNERQYLEKKSRGASLPARCFKLPPNSNTSVEVQVFRCVKRASTGDDEPKAKKQAFTTVHSSLGETFEMVTGSSPDSFVIRKSKSEVVQPPARQVPTRYSRRLSTHATSAQSMINLPKRGDKPKEPELVEKPKAAAPPPPKKTRSHRSSQTDEPPAPEAQKSGDESKDDKIVALLYPEYKGVSKVKLIEQVKEKDQRIAILEEKIEKMEEAMNKLL